MDNNMQHSTDMLRCHTQMRHSCCTYIWSFDKFKSGTDDGAQCEIGRLPITNKSIQYVTYKNDGLTCV